MLLKMNIFTVYQELNTPEGGAGAILRTGEAVVLERF
jgi:hypothetical protein